MATSYMPCYISKLQQSYAKRASFLAPAVGLILVLVIRQHGARYVRVILITSFLLFGSLSIPGLFAVIDAIRAM